MRFFYIFLLFFAQLSIAKQIKVAVVDTGIKLIYANKVKLCKNGHRDFTSTGFNDNNGHGTNVAGLIAKNNDKVDYCLIIIKFFNKNDRNNVNSLIQSLLHVSNLDVDIVNLSLGGTGSHVLEKKLIKRILDQSKIIVAAAGNDNFNLNENCKYFPACYDDRVIVIGNNGSNSNTGNKHIDIIIDGNNKNGLGVKLSGSSQSAAIYTQRLIRKLHEKR